MKIVAAIISRALICQSGPSVHPSSGKLEKLGSHKESKVWEIRSLITFSH